MAFQMKLACRLFLDSADALPMDPAIVLTTMLVPVPTQLPKIVAAIMKAVCRTSLLTNRSATTGRPSSNP